MLRKTLLMTLTLLAAGCVVALLAADERPGKTITRAKPPEFTPQDTAGIFFDDVFSEGLVGKRPDNLGRPPAAPAADPGGTPPAGGGETGGGGVFAWSQIIPATVLEDEVKAIKLKVDENVTTPGKFASQGYKLARRDFTVLALLFAIIGEFDGDVRWKEFGPGLREAFARSAKNAKAGSSQVFQEAQLRKQDLADIVAGQNYVTEGTPSREADWSQVADRAPLMQRLESAHQARLSPWTASEGEFKANKDKALHEAALVAAMAEVLQKEGMLDSDDPDYAGLAERMKQGALEIIQGAKMDDYERARKAAGEIGQACAACHEVYRA